jgi:hypothetical protein
MTKPDVPPYRHPAVAAAMQTWIAQHPGEWLRWTYGSPLAQHLIDRGYTDLTVWPQSIGDLVADMKIWHHPTQNTVRWRDDIDDPRCFNHPTRKAVVGIDGRWYCNECKRSAAIKHLHSIGKAGR